MTDKFYTPKQVSEMLQYSREYIYRLLNKTVNNGGIPSVKIGNSRRIKESDLNDWINSKYEE